MAEKPVMTGTYLFPAEERQKVLDEAATYYGVKIKDIDEPGRSHRQEVVHARWVVIAILKGYMGYTGSQISRALKCDHTTVIYAMRKIEESEQLQRVVEQVALNAVHGPRVR
jgi:chromosomal replication initiation ATPase DnaA